MTAGAENRDRHDAVDRSVRWTTVWRSSRRTTLERLSGRNVTRAASLLVVSLCALTQVPVVAAHDATALGGLSRGYGVGFFLLGVAVLGGAVAAKRTRRISPTVAVYAVFVGICVTALGAILFEGLSPEPRYTAQSMPFPRSWYRPLALLGGLLVTVASFLVGWLRWPTRPRYTFLGIALGLWIAYPYLLPGQASSSHPLGYAIVVGTPVLVGYVVWTDAGTLLGSVLRDPVARRFGIGVAVVLGLFFVTVSGYLSFFPEAGVPHETAVVVLPVIYQLVAWPTVEIVAPHVPFFLAVSPGQVLVVGTLSGLVGLNAAVVARQWRLEERAGFAEGTAGSAAIVGSCTCGCCGPLVAKVAVLAAGPSVAAPIYWVFVDGASPLSALFVVGSLVLFTGSLVYSVETGPDPERPPSTVTAG